MTPDAHRQFKDRLYGQFARIGKALSSPHRLEILELLAQSERTVDSLATEIGLPEAGNPWPSVAGRLASTPTAPSSFFGRADEGRSACSTDFQSGARRVFRWRAAFSLEH